MPPPVQGARGRLPIPAMAFRSSFPAAASLPAVLWCAVPFALVLGGPGVAWDAATAAGAGSLAFALGKRLWRRQVGGCFLAILAFLPLLILPDLAQLARHLLPVLGYATLCACFWTTLRSGKEPLIARYTRHDLGGLPTDCVSYTRGLTFLWGGVFAVLVLLHLLQWMLLGLHDWPLATVTPLALLLLFLGEHWIRGRVLPQHGRATPWRTMRAILAEIRSSSSSRAHA